jgi:hypothetical protein
MMETVTLEMTPEDRSLLSHLAQDRGLTESQVVHEALTQLVGGMTNEERLRRFRQARGIWKDRTDLPDWEALRAECDRY